MNIPMSMQSPDSYPRECAVAYAGQEAVLLIEEREGRLPLRAVRPGGGSWMCADGRWEHLDIRGSNGEQGWRDLATIAVMGATKGMLVAELPAEAPVEVSSSDFVKQWIMRAHAPKSIAFMDEPGIGAHQFQVDEPRFSGAYEPSSTQDVYARMQAFKKATGSSKVTMRIYDETQGLTKLDVHGVGTSVQAVQNIKNADLTAWRFQNDMQSAVSTESLRAWRSADNHFARGIPFERHDKTGWASWLKFARHAVMFVAVACLAHEAIKVKDYFFDKPQIKQSVDWVAHTQHHDNFPVSLAAAAPSSIEDHPHLSDEQRAMEEIRRKLNYIQVNYQGRTVMVLDTPSKVLLAQQAAEASDLSQMGLNWKDLYGVIHAETAWIPRDGMGKNGVVSEGLAQMEAATAKALGISDSNDDVEAVFGAARLLKEAASWSKNKVSKLRLPKNEFNQKLREGVSIYYNLSSATRRTWDGLNTDQMPIETNHHIKNTRDGARFAAQMEVKFRSMDLAQSLQVGSGHRNAVQSADEYVPRRRHDTIY